MNALSGWFESIALRGCAVLAALIVFGCLASAREATAAEHTPGTSPAYFGTERESLLGQMHCPTDVGDVKNDVVFCKAAIRANGNVDRRNTYCFSTNGLPRAARASRNALARAQFHPARLRGVNAPVQMLLRMNFEWNETGCRVTALPNTQHVPSWGGDGYGAPQKLIDQPRWQMRVPAPWRLRCKAHTRHGECVLLSTSVLVGTDGRPSDARVEAHNRATPTQSRAAMEYLMSAKFVPGLRIIPEERRGTPVEMRFYEWFYLF